MNKTERNRYNNWETALYFLCFESTRERKMFHFDTEWEYKHLVIIVAVHKMNLRLWNKNSKRRYLEKVMGKRLVSTHKTWNRPFLISFNYPLLTLPGIQIDLYPTFLFSGIPTHTLCLYVSVCHSC